HRPRVEAPLPFIGNGGEKAETAGDHEGSRRAVGGDVVRGRILPGPGPGLAEEIVVVQLAEHHRRGHQAQGREAGNLVGLEHATPQAGASLDGGIGERHLDVVIEEIEIEIEIRVLRTRGLTLRGRGKDQEKGGEGACENRADGHSVSPRCRMLRGHQRRPQSETGSFSRTLHTCLTRPRRRATGYLLTLTSVRGRKSTPFLPLGIAGPPRITTPSIERLTVVSSTSGITSLSRTLPSFSTFTKVMSKDFPRSLRPFSSGTETVFFS